MNSDLTTDPEISILGAVLLDPAILPELREEIEPSDFKKLAHRRIFEAILNLANRDTRPDLITLTDILTDNGSLKSCGGPAYIASLTSAIPSSANWEYYASIVKDHSNRRRLTQLLKDAEKDLQRPTVNSELYAEILERAEYFKNGKSRKKRELQLLNVTDILKAPPVEWLIDGVLFDRTFSILGSYTGYGKSILALAIARSIADGFPLFGRYEVLRTGPVLFVDEENSHSDLRDRMMGMKITGDLPIYFLSFQGIFLDDDKSYNLLLEKIKEVKPVLVIFDSLVRFHHAKENDASEMSQVLGKLRQIVNSGPGVLGLHHHGKALGALEVRARGSSDIVGICDVEYALYKDRDKNLVLCSVKSRRAPIEPITLKIEKIDDELLVSCLGTASEQREDLLEGIVEHLRDEPSGRTDLGDWLANQGKGVGEKTLRGYLQKLLEDGKIKVDTEKRHGKKIYSGF